MIRIILFSLLISISHNVNAQENRIITLLKGDSVKLITEARGELSWESSTDHDSWSVLAGENASIVSVSPVESTWYRGRVEEGDCDPIYSEETYVEVVDAARPRNLILIMVDDVSAKELSCYGGSGIVTPHIDLMASRGLMFETAYALPVCGPTRACLHTGKYAHSTLHYGNSVIPSHSLFSRHHTLGQAMKDAGYRTAWFGKQHIDNGSTLPGEIGYDQYMVNTYSEGYDGTWQERGSPTSGMYSVQWYWHPGYVCKGAGIPTGPEDFGPLMELDSILSFISTNAEDPMFIYWPTNLPHHQYSTAEGWTRPEVPEFDAEGMPTGKRIAGSMKSNLEFMDHSIGQILDRLKEEDILEHSLLFFVGDNGTAGYGKGLLNNEVGPRVPFIVYGPGTLRERGSSQVLVDFTDLMPTLVELAGGECNPLSPPDGHSFAPYLLGNDFEPRSWISSQLNEARWLRTREWLLDGEGHFWYCGRDADEQQHQDVTFENNPEFIMKRRELEALLNQHIPFPDLDHPYLKSKWEAEFLKRPPYEIYSLPEQ